MMQYTRKNKKWFLDRIGRRILAEHAAGSETTLVIESKRHAEILCNQRQNKDGYCFSDLIADEQKEK